MNFCGLFLLAENLEQHNPVFGNVYPANITSQN